MCIWQIRGDGGNGTLVLISNDSHLWQIEARMDVVTKFQNLLQHFLFSFPNIIANAIGNIEPLVLHPYAENWVYFPKFI